MVDAKIIKLVDEVNVLRNEMVKSFELQKSHVLDIEEEMKEKMKEEMREKIEEEMNAVNATIQEMGQVKAGTSERFRVTFLVVGVVGWICGKLLS